MAGFLFRLETRDGTPAEPSTLSAAVPNWRPGDAIYLARRTLRVVGVRDQHGDLVGESIWFGLAVAGLVAVGRAVERRWRGATFKL